MNPKHGTQSTSHRRSSLIWMGAVAVAILAAALLWTRPWQLSNSGTGTNPPGAVRTRVVINEAIRTLLYIPLYHAIEKGYFDEAGIDVELVTGGTATNSFTALLSGEAQFSQADPMYVPISREKGGKTKVVAQVVGRIAVWGLTNDASVGEWTADAVRGKTVSTQVRPMTAFVYANQAIARIGLNPETDVRLLQSKPPGEIAPLFNGEAQFAFTLEPNATLAESQGAKVVLSFPRLLGDQVFTGLMTTEEYIAENGDTVRAVVKAYQQALDDLQMDPTAAVDSARKYFPTLDEAVIRTAMRRLIDERVIPVSVEISEESWNRAVKARVESGDLKKHVELSDGCDLQIMKSTK